MSTTTKAGITELGSVIVPVSDQDRALDFYVGLLGFEKRMDDPYGDGLRWVEVAPAGATTGISLSVPAEGTEGMEMPIGIDTNIVLMTDDIDATHEYLGAHDVDQDSEVMRMGAPVPPMFFFRDRDGNRLLAVQSGAA